MSIKTPEQIAVDTLTQRGADPESAVRTLLIAAIEADRAQHQPEIYIAQNDAGEIVGVYRDADEATAFHQEGYSIIEETVSEPGVLAEARIAELTAAWEESTGDHAADYWLSQDDWSVGLDDDEAAEIARLIDWKKDNA